MTTPALSSLVVSARTAVADRTVPFVVVGLTAALVAFGWLSGLPSIVLVAVSTLPLVIVFGYRVALVALSVVLVLRALVDDLGGQTITAGVAAAVIGLSVFVLVRAPGWPARVLAIALALFASAGAGAATYGAVATYGEAVRVLSLVAVAVITINAPGTVTFGRVTGVVQLVGIIPALVALLQFATGTGTASAGVLRSTGTLAQANSAAALFAVCTIVTFARLLAGGRHRARDAALLVVFLVVQVTTASVGGFLTVLVMMIVYLLVEAGRRMHRVVLGLLAVVVTVVAAINSQIGATRFSEFSGGTEDTSLGWRYQAWAKVLAAWHEHPVFGNGLGATTSGIILKSIPHNEYVRMLAEVGVVGLTVLSLLALWYAVAMLRRLLAGSPRSVCALGLAVLVGTMVNAIAANTMLYTVAFMTTVYVLSACWRIARETPPPDPVPQVEPALARAALR
ncbi:O-antigen ligase family protein [uncultured Cellulomonas sp.]|uniref:O-antigen ligase family protein n=1 Tax=uncultured Cellulomonas sp. TaxID=189682 RepID=UPI0028EFD969|nr:O-antigen ligase family protein [uncultured Cellulomonas sp.]